MKTGIAALQLIIWMLIAGCAACPLHHSQTSGETSKAGPASVQLASGKGPVNGESGVEVTALSKTILSWDGNTLPPFPSGQPEITILRITIPPGVTLPVHTHPVINAGVLLEGELTVLTENGARLDLKAGEGIVEVVDTWHYGRNDGDTPAEIIVFYAGTQGEPITVQRGGPEK